MPVPVLNNLLNKVKWQVIFIAAVIFFLYSRSLSYDFIELDEQSLLIEKGEFNRKLSSIPKAFTQHVFETESYVGAPGSLKFYRPLLTVSFILDAQLAGKTFSFFHFSNILYHLLAVTGLLFVLIRSGASPPLAFLLALVFAVHPLLMQAVAWIPGRNDSIACAFVLWSYYHLLNYVKTKTTGNLFVHILLFAGALFTKENAAMFTFLCLFALLFIHGKTTSPRHKLMLIFCYTAITALWFVAKNAATGMPGSSLSLSSLYYSFLANFPLMLQYIQKTLLPVNLAVMAAVKDTSYVWVFMVFVLLGSGIYLTRNIPWAELLFGFLWFFLFLLPTLLFSYFEGMEHRSYLPAAGVFMAAIHLDPVRKLEKAKGRLTAVLGAAAFILAIITYKRLPVFSGELSYWKNAYETSAHSEVVCRDYGVSLTKAGDYDNAEKAFLEGIRRNPEKSLIHYNLGVLYYHMNRLEEAKEQLIKETTISPDNFMLYHLLGEIYKKQNSFEQASAMWERSVQINPAFTEPYKELLTYYARINDTLRFNRCKGQIEKNGLRITDRRKKN